MTDYPKCPHVFTELEAWPRSYGLDDIPPETVTAGERCGLRAEFIEIGSMTTRVRGEPESMATRAPHPAGGFAKCARGHTWSVETGFEGAMPEDIEVVHEPRL